jgi:hypothetical protein
MADKDEYKINILSLALHVKKIANKPAYVAAVNKKMDNGERSRFPLVRSVIKTRTIPKGSVFVTLNDVFSGRYDRE